MKTFILAAFTGSFIATTLTFGLIRSVEPRYQDRTLTIWLAELNSSGPAQRRHAQAALQVMGTNALPELSKLLRAKDSLLRQKLIEICEHYPIFDLVPAEARYDCALEACQVLGPVSAPLTPDIIRFLESNHRGLAVKVLAGIGDQAISSLMAELQDWDEQVRAGAVVALGSIARQPHIVVPALMERLDDRSPETRMAAAWALGRFGGQAALAAQALSLLTNDSSYNVSEQAKLALARIITGAQTRATSREDAIR